MSPVAPEITDHYLRMALEALEQRIEQLVKVELSGIGTPEGVVVAGVGTRYRRTDGGAGTSLYVKESGTGNTGWVAK